MCSLLQPPITRMITSEPPNLLACRNVVARLLPGLPIQ
jgi:hypothetical protein